MQLNDVLEVLPPRVYLRRGELVIHFTSPGDLVARIAETQAAFSEIERPSDAGRSESRPRGRVNGRVVSTSTLIGHTHSETTQSESRAGDLEGKED